MNYKINNLKDIWIVILGLALTKLLPHPPNFTPYVAFAVMSGILFNNKYLSIATILASMAVADYFIGFYNGMIYLYFSLAAVSFLSFYKKINYKNLYIHAIFGAFIFFALSNFFVWMNGNMYTKDINGLILCYVMAIPFFTNTLLSTVLFSYLIITLKNINKIFSSIKKIKIIT
tara:strand:+ start:614 stop:1135 length:522 start_codon:yes stop_codon:yes gene_type:complete